MSQLLGFQVLAGEATDCRPLDLGTMARTRALVAGIPEGILYAVVAYDLGGPLPLLVLSQGPTPLELAAAILADSPQEHDGAQLLAHSSGVSAADLGMAA